MEDPISSAAQKKETTTKDGAVLDSEPCGPLYRGGDCCFSSCAYTSDHYHCQVCGISTPEVSQALAHIRASPACRKDPNMHYPACSVTMPTEAANSLYNVLYSGFTAQNTYPTGGFNGYSQIEPYQWHPSMSEKVAICSGQLSPCCSSNGTSYIPVESTLCSPIGDLYSKITGPMRDLVSLPAKSGGSAIDSQAWFAAYSPQQMQKVAYKFSDQNAAPQNNFLPVDTSDLRHHQELNSSSVGDSSVNTPSTYCGKSDVIKEPYCVFTSQSGMLSEDAFFSLQLPEEALKQADIQHSPLPQIMLNDVNVISKSASHIEGSGNCSRIENHFTQEHFGHYMADCNPYPPSEEHENISGRSTEVSNQLSSAASDSDESDIIVEDTGDELETQMTESEIFIEDIKCSLLQGVVNEEDDQPCNNGETLDQINKEPEGLESRRNIQAVSSSPSCVPAYTILNCVICERNVSDDNSGSVFFQMNTEMPLTTSSQTPVLTKLNEVIPLELLDNLGVNGKFMCQSCFNLVDTVDSLESKLQSLKQNITSMIKTSFKPRAIINGLSRNLNIKSLSNSVHMQSVQALLQQHSQMEATSLPRPMDGLMDGHEMNNSNRPKNCLLLSSEAMSVINNRVRGDSHSHSPELTTERICKAHTSSDSKLSNVPELSEDSSQLQISSITQSQEEVSSRIDNEKTACSDIIEAEICHATSGKGKVEECHREFIQEQLSQQQGTNVEIVTIGYQQKDKEDIGGKANVRIAFGNTQSSEQQPHSSDCAEENCHEVLYNEKMVLIDVKKESITAHHLLLACDQCKEMFSSYKSLENHKALYAELDPLLCEVCGEMFHDQAKLDDHVFYLHFIYQKHCEVCDLKFFHPCTYKMHLQIHSGGKMYSCSHCALSFVQKSSAIEHETVCSSSSQLKCLVCNEMFRVHSELEQHKRLVHEGDNAVIDCDKIKKTGDLQVLKKAVVVCDKCNKTFLKPSDLQAHLRSHSNEKKFECKVCGRKYKSLGNLNHHAKSHETDKPYTCELCSQGFIRKDFFETHLNSHKGNKPFKCDKCPKDFWSKSYLQVHLNWHLDKIKKVTCPVCHKSFSQRLNVHMRSHTGERPHPCEKCPRKFITGSALRKHMRQVHKDATASEFSDFIVNN